MTTPDAPESTDEPVTVVVTRLVKPGREEAYEAWLRKLVAGASTMPGYLGTTVHPPGPTGPREYTSVYRFDSVANLRAFERSEHRAQAMAEVADLVEADAVWRRMTGLELWFAPPAGTLVPQPSRPRMALLLFAVVYLLVLSLGRLVGIVAEAWPAWLRMLVTIGVEVLIMTYLLMPWLTRRLSRWLYPSRRSA